MARYRSQNRIDIAIPGQPVYPLFIGEGLLHSELLFSQVKSKQLMIVTDDTVAPLYLDRVRDAFSSIQCDAFILPTGETSKSLYHLGLIYDALIEKGYHRDATLLALGGGVVGDICGLAASTYQRGIAYIQVPTTLLAQIDAAVGGKTAINHALGKNMIGSFYQPQMVLMDTDTLLTLPIREFRAGLSEMIKYALLSQGDFFDLLYKALEQGITARDENLVQWISLSCKVKAQYVMADEKDTGCRALLNLGHTFAHALESSTHYVRWLHGEAVAIGLYCAALLSCKMGILDTFWLSKIEKMLHFAGLPHKIPQDLDINTLITSMQRDKKIKDNKLSFVLIRKPGDCYLNTVVTQDYLYETLLESQMENEYGK